MSTVTIVVFCNKNDFFLTKICISSIRYFYPDIEILLVKDELNGKFSTKELEKRFQVNIFDCGKRKFGWAAAKTFFLLQANVGKKYLLLDSDIVFIEPFLERLLPKVNFNDIVVSADFYENVYTKHVRETYFDVTEVETFDPTYAYPGFFFNTGQIFITGGAISVEQLFPFFDRSAFPYWKRLDTFPLVDQSLYNYLFPTLTKRNELTLETDKFMIWSESEEAKNITLDKVIARCEHGGLIHWAGARRTPYLKKMSNSSVLEFFEQEYYKNIFLGSWLKFYRTQAHILNGYYVRLRNKMTPQKKADT
jgi:hypothetical protein